MKGWLLVMEIKQLSIFIENKKGRLAEITQILADNQIDIRAISVADTSDFGILRIIVDKPDDAAVALKNAGLTVSLSKVIVVEIVDKPGAFAEVVGILSDNEISIEYVYAFMSREKGRAFVIVRADNALKAAQILKDNGVGVMSNEEIAEL